MRVVIDAMSIEVGGGRRYFNGLVPVLISNRRNWNFLVLAKKGIFDGGSRNANMALIELPRVLCKFPLGLIIQQCVLPILGWMTRARAVFSLSDIGPIWSPVPVLATVGNAFIYRAFSRSKGYRLSKADLPLLDRIRTRGLGVMNKLFLRSVKALIFLTAASRSEVEFLIRRRLRSIVIHNGEPYHATRANPNSGLRKKQIICIATIVRYRNQLRLVHAFRKLLNSDARCREFSLLLIGDVCDGRYASSIRRFVKAEQLQEHVQILGDIPYDQVHEYYSESWGLVFPSRVETYGFPVVEGLFSRIPMGLSDIPAFRELAGSAAIYFDPEDINSIRDGLERLLWDDMLRERLLEAGKTQCLQYSWQTTAACTAKMIEDIVDMDGHSGREGEARAILRGAGQENGENDRTWGQSK